MMTLFDEEQIMKNHDATLTRELMITNIKNAMAELKIPEGVQWIFQEFSQQSTQC